jgi:hypothetical protein
MNQEFTLILSGPTEVTESLADTLFEAGCDDATVGSRGGVVHMHFDREADTFQEAVVSAIRDVWSAGIEVARIDLGDVVTAGEIARRINRSRECVRLYASGARGPAGFPEPTGRANARSPLYRWAEVAAWLAKHGLSDESATDFREVELINATLSVRRLGKVFPETKRSLEALEKEPTRKMAAAVVAPRSVKARDRPKKSKA